MKKTGTKVFLLLGFSIFVHIAIPYYIQAQEVSDSVMKLAEEYTLNKLP